MLSDIDWEIVCPLMTICHVVALEILEPGIRDLCGETLVNVPALPCIDSEKKRTFFLSRRPQTSVMLTWIAETSPLYIYLLIIIYL